MFVYADSVLKPMNHYCFKGFMQKVILRYPGKLCKLAP